MTFRIAFPTSIDAKNKGWFLSLLISKQKNLAFRTFDHKYEFLEVRDLLRTDRIAGVTYNYRKTFYTTHSLKFEFRNSSIADTVKERNPNYFKGETKTQQFAWISYQYNVDRRDFLAYPLNGYQFTASASRIGLGLGDDVNKTEANLLFSKFWDLKKKFYLANNTVLYWSTPDDLAYVNFGVLGLEKQFVRGYEIYVIEGP